MSRRLRPWRVALSGVWIALTALRANAAEPVDVQLVLAVDVSLSMSAAELEIQRHGYAAALTHETVLQAIADNLVGQGYRESDDPSIWQLHMQAELRRGNANQGRFLSGWE